MYVSRCCLWLFIAASTEICPEHCADSRHILYTVYAVMSMLRVYMVGYISVKEPSDRDVTAKEHHSEIAVTPEQEETEQGPSRQDHNAFLLIEMADIER